MSRWGADLAWLQSRILPPYHPLYPTLFYTMPPRSILSRCSTRHPSNRESISRRFATPFIPCAPPTKPLTPRSCNPLPSCPFSSPPVTSHYSLYLPIPYRRFLPLSISSHLATTVSLPFNTFPYPLQTFSYPSHALSIPPRPLPSFRIFAHPVTPHSVLFLSIAPLPVFFANPLLSISYPIPFAVFSFPLA